TMTVARLACRSTALREPAPLTVIDRLLDRPAMLPSAAPESVIDNESLSSLVALTEPAPLILSFFNSLTVTLKRGPLLFQTTFPSVTPRMRVPSLTSEVNSAKRLSSAVSSRLSWPGCSISRLAEPDALMAVNLSTDRVSLLGMPEPLIVGPPSDQLQAARTSRDDKAAAVRNMTQASKNGRGAGPQSGLYAERHLPSGVPG